MTGFLFDTHVHSWYSRDAWQSPESILRRAGRIGLHAVAITDHLTIAGGLAARAIPGEAVLVVVGAEMSTEYGDLTGLFLNQEIHARTFHEVIDAVHDQGGLVVLPHPFRRKRFPDQADLTRIDLIEGTNARSRGDQNERARALCLDLGKPCIAGSDAHFPFEIGRAITVLDAPEAPDEETLRKILSSGQCRCRGSAAPAWLRKPCMGLSWGIRKVRRPLTPAHQ